MIPIRGLFEAHLAVADLDRSIRFYRDTLGLPLAQTFPERKAAFFWAGAPGKSMLGLWESSAAPNTMQLHIAFGVTLDALFSAAAALIAKGIAPLDFDGRPATEPQVLAWMPAASIYFRDPDGHLLEFICLLEGEQPAPDRGVVPYSVWRKSL